MKWSRLSFTLTYSPFHNGANVHRLRRSNLTHFWQLRCSFGFDKVCRVILKQQSTNVKFWRREGQLWKFEGGAADEFLPWLQIFTNWTYFWIGMLCATKTASNFHNVTGTKFWRKSYGGMRVAGHCRSFWGTWALGRVAGDEAFRMGFLDLSGELLKKLQLEQSECKHF